MSRSRVVRVVAGVVVAVALSGCWWVQPRFDPGRTNWNPGEKTLTAANVGGLQELWDTPLDPSPRAPIRIGSRLFVTTGSDQGIPTSSVAALDTATGKILWQDESIDPGGHFVLPDAPAYADGKVVVPAFTSNPRLPTFDGGLYRFDPETGASEGAFEDAFYGDAAVVDGELVVSRGEGDVGSCFVVVQRVEWTYRPTVVTTCPLPIPLLSDYAIIGDRVLWGAGNQAWGYSAACPPYPGAPPGFEGCGPDWTVDLGGLPTAPAKVRSGGIDSAVYADETGTVTALRPEDGALVWRAELGPFALIDLPPSVPGDHVFVVSRDGRLFSLPESGCGQPVCGAEWTAALGAAPTVPVAAGGDVVYVGLSNGQIKAFPVDGCGAATCSPLATVDTGSAVTGLIVSGGRVYAGSADGTITAFGLRKSR